MICTRGKSNSGSFKTKNSLHDFSKKLWLTSAATCLLVPIVQAQDPGRAGPDQIVEEVVTIGTRAKGRTATDIPVPIDVVDASAMEQTGSTEVGRMLQKLVPSFNFSSSSVSDGTDALRPATLRGLGPDQTLVLVNGKRRHTSALIHVNTSVGRGTAGVDMNAIPASAIKRIEVLRDGASAQYGSDAIAGVINIVLKDDDEVGKADFSYGETTESDGETTVFSLNKGLPLGDGGMANLTYEYRDRGRTDRSGDDGSRQYALVGGGFDAREYTFDRNSFRVGDAESEQHSFVVSGDLPLNDTTSLYTFATYSSREHTSGGFYRKADDSRNPNVFGTSSPQYPDGFLPLIETDIEDLSFAFGSEFKLGDWDMDASLNWGENTFEFGVKNSLNASYAANIGPSPTSADAGELTNELTTFNFDGVRDFDNFTLATGAEYKVERYELSAGEPLSYEDYNTAGGSVPIGIQVFPGYRPTNEQDKSRYSYALYGDIEYNFTDNLMISGALRYEDFNDFGDTTNGKIAGRYTINEMFTLRASTSTGFRAPSMQQQYFNATSTQFNGSGVPAERRTFANNDPIVSAIGIDPLEEEKSFSYAAGVVITPTDVLTITLDYYSIDIDDRIVISGALDNADVGGAFGPNVDEGQFFINGVDTETQGFDLVVTYAMAVGNGDLNLSAAANWTETDVVKEHNNSSIPSISDKLFTEQDISIIEDWQPEDRLNLSATYLLGGWTASLSINRYGEYSVTESSGCGNSGVKTTADGNCTQTFGEEWITDLQVSYAFENGIAVRVGGNNIFDEYPDENKVGQSRGAPAGGLVDPANGNVLSTSPGVFEYSRRSAPFGFNGAYFYGGVSYSF